MTRYSVEHTTGSKVLSGIALLLVSSSFVNSNAALGLAALVFTPWGLTFIRVRADSVG